MMVVQGYVKAFLSEGKYPLILHIQYIGSMLTHLVMAYAAMMQDYFSHNILVSAPGKLAY